GPPFARFGICEVRIDGVAGPDAADVGPAIGLRHPYTLRRALVVNRIPWIVFNAGIDDGDCMEAIGVKIVHELFGIGKPARAPGEAAVAVHVVDVEIDYVAWNVFVAK